MQSFLPYTASTTKRNQHNAGIRLRKYPRQPGRPGLFSDFLNPVNFVMFRRAPRPDFCPADTMHKTRRWTGQYSRQRLAFAEIGSG